MAYPRSLRVPSLLVGALVCAALNARDARADEPTPPPSDVVTPAAPSEPPPPPHADVPAALPPTPAPLATPSPLASPAPTYGFNDSDGFFVASSDKLFKLKLHAFIQTRFTLDTPDAKPADSVMNLSVFRAQFSVGGNAFSEALTWKFAVENGQGFTFIKDAYLNYSFVPGWLEMRVGKWKRPFNRQWLTPDWREAFVDRGIDNGFFFGGDRDIGAALHNDIEKSPPVEYAVGIFDGSTEKSKLTGDVKFDDTADTLPFEKAGISDVPTFMTPTLVAHIGFNQGDVKGYFSEIDTDGGPLRFGLSASAIESIDLQKKAAGGTRTVVDAIAKAYGFDGSAALFLSATQKLADGPQALQATGVHAQAGYLVGIVHPGVRWDFIHGLAANSDQHEFTVGTSTLFIGESLKWLVDASYLLTQQPTGEMKPDYRVRTQLELGF